MIINYYENENISLKEQVRILVKESVVTDRSFVEQDFNLTNRISPINEATTPREIVNKGF